MQSKKQATPTLVGLITASQYKDSNIVRHFGTMTMVKAMNTKAPTIWRWTKDEGDDKMIPAIARLFIGASLYFDKAITQDQGEVIVMKMLNDYEMSNLKLEDLVVCCKELTESTQYGKLTPAKILAHIKGYLARRTQAAIDGSLDDVQRSKMYGNDINQRLHDTLLKTAKDKSGAVDRTRSDARKYYK